MCSVIGLAGVGATQATQFGIRRNRFTLTVNFWRPLPNFHDHIPDTLFYFAPV